MFFPERITGIKPTDKVLEIGPGGNPHPRADVLLELSYDNAAIAKMQRGNTEDLVTDKKIVYYDGQFFPFNDHEFDYVICSHVIEHVDNVEQFLAELFRVAPRGYLEYPTIYYEYLYNFSVHVNFVKFKEGQMVYMKKADSGINEFAPVQRLLLDALGKGHNALVDDLRAFMFEGFEWTRPFKATATKKLEELAWGEPLVPPRLSVKHNFFSRLARRLSLC